MLLHMMPNEEIDKVELQELMRIPAQKFEMISMGRLFLLLI